MPYLLLLTLLSERVRGEAKTARFRLLFALSRAFLSFLVGAGRTGRGRIAIGAETVFASAITLFTVLAKPCALALCVPGA